MIRLFKNFALLLTAIVLIGLQSCYKKKDTLARILVLDSNAKPVTGAEVRVFYDDDQISENNNIDQTGTTDLQGVVNFNFNDIYKAGMAGVAVLDIQVNSVVVGVIKIVEETTSDATVSI